MKWVTGIAATLVFALLAFLRALTGRVIVGLI